jgi:hypothetical protein
MNVRTKLLDSFQKRRRKLGLDSGHDQKPIDRWINLAGAQKNFICGIASLRRSGNFFEKNADFVAGSIPKPILDALDNRLSFSRDGSIFPSHETRDDAGSMRPKFLSLALPLPAHHFGRNLFRRSCEKL